MNKKNSPTPIVTRLSSEDADLINELHLKTGLSKSDIIRRACRYAVPKFHSGKANVLTLEDGGEAVKFSL